MHAPLSTHEIDLQVRSCTYGDGALAALHVALPMSSVVGIDAHLDPHTRVVTWRQLRERVDNSGTSVVEQVHHLVAQGWQSGDQPAHTQYGTPVIKTLRSGAYHVAFGAELYIDRKVLVEPTFDNPAAVAQSYINSITRQEQTAGTGVHVLCGSESLVHDDGRTVRISNPHEHQPATVSFNDPADTIDAIADELAATFELDAFTVATLGSRTPGTLDVDFVGSWVESGQRYDIIIPATLGNGAVIGAPYGPAAPAVHDWYASGNCDPWYELTAFEPLTTAAVEPGWLARHRSSGIVVLVRNGD